MDLKPKSVLQGMAGAILSLAIVAGAQTPSTPPTTTPDSTTPAAPAAAAPAASPTWSVGPVDFSGFVDGYYSYNANRPGQNVGQINQLYNFNDLTDQFSLEAAKLSINHDPDPIGAHVDLIFGRTNAFLHPQTGCSVSGLTECSTDNFIEQAYLSIKPPKAKGFEMDFGQFVTSAGAEVIETMTNYNYSHGILFGYAIPYYHFGLRTSMPVTKAWTVGYQLVNGWNNVSDNNGGVTHGFTSAVVKSKASWYFNVYTGPENFNTQHGYRNLIDTTVTLTPTPKFSWLLNYDYGQNKYAAYTQGTPSGTIHYAESSPHWQGIATAARDQMMANSAVAFRYEYFADNQGFSTGSRQKLNEVTATYEYKWPAGLLMRAEYRRDWSNIAFFNKGDFNSVNAQSTATVGFIAFFGPKR